MIARSIARLAGNLLTRRSRRDRRRAARLGVEPLEGRDVPASVFTVEALADATEGGAAGAVRVSYTGEPGDPSDGWAYLIQTGGTADAAYDLGSGWIGYTDVPIEVANDAIPEGDETITLSLVVYSPSTATVGTPGSATITIHDPPPPVVSVERVNDAVEGETDGAFRFTRTGDLSQPLTVTYKVAETGPSLATPVDDYTPLTETVTFAAYASAVDVPVAPADDSTVEPDEVVMVTIAAASTYTIGTGAANVWIADDDGGLMIWVAASPGDWWEPSNWQANRAPEPNDHLYFIGSYSQQNMTSLGSLPLTYAGIHVASDYTGTVSLTAPVSVGTLEMAATGGTIDQPNGTGSALTVTSRFEWTGGTINASATVSTVTVQTAVALVSTAANASVTLGSDLVFDAAAEAAVEAQVNLTNPTGIDVLGGSGLTLGAGTSILSAIQAIGERNTIRVGGEHSRFFTRGAATADLGLWVNGGTAELRGVANGEVVVTFRGMIRDTNGVPVTGVESTSVYMTGGKLIIGEGARLNVPYPRAVFVQGGKLATRVTAGRQDHVASITAPGGLYVAQKAGGAPTEVVICDPSLNPPGDSEFHFGELSVTGFVEWRGGTYRPLLSPTGVGSTTWIASGGFRIGRDGVVPGPVLGPTSGSQLPPAPSEFLVISASGTGRVYREVTPMFEAGNPNWTIKPPANPDTQFVLRQP